MRPSRVGDTLLDPFSASMPSWRIVDSGLNVVGDPPVKGLGSPGSRRDNLGLLSRIHRAFPLWPELVSVPHIPYNIHSFSNFYELICLRPLQVDLLFTMGGLVGGVCVRGHLADAANSFAPPEGLTLA